MKTKLISILLAGLLLSGCGLANNNIQPLASPIASATDVPTEVPTRTPVPTPTATLPPTPDMRLVGLPAEASGTTAFDFVKTVCDAEWFTVAGRLPCPGDPGQPGAGYVMGLSGDSQGLPPGISLIVAYPPQDAYSTIFSRYPSFTVEKGDRFRAVLACKAHTFCDVVFSFEYYENGRKTGVANWPYRFSSAPLIMDFPLDGFAGKTVQFGLSVTGVGNRTEAYAAWIAPHVYRPVH